MASSIFYHGTDNPLWVARGDEPWAPFWVVEDPEIAAHYAGIDPDTVEAAVEAWADAKEEPDEDWAQEALAQLRRLDVPGFSEHARDIVIVRVRFEPRNPLYLSSGEEALCVLKPLLDEQGIWYPDPEDWLTSEPDARSSWWWVDNYWQELMELGYDAVVISDDYTTTGPWVSGFRSMAILATDRVELGW